jgi:hypothetical protein
LRQKLKSTFFEFFQNRMAVKRLVEWWKNFKKNVDFSIWGNRATTQNTHLKLQIFPILEHCVVQDQTIYKIQQMGSF